MRYSSADHGRSDLWQRILFVLLGAACVVLCYFVGAYWIGPWLHSLRGKQEAASTAPSAPVSAQMPPPSTLSTPPLSPAPPKLEGVQIRERDPSTLSDTVRVIPSGGSSTPDEATPTEEPQPPTTLEEQPSVPTPPANLWAPRSSPPAPSRPAGGAESPSGGVQVPQTLDGEPAPIGTAPSTPATPAPSDTLYRVRVSGSFENREQADATLRTITDKGLPGAIVTDTVNGRKVFRIQLGVYRNRSSAENLAEQARRSGIPVEVTAPSP
ncbi:MAG: SPOR domain-containing protein [Armatimonadota bacterium]